MKKRATKNDANKFVTKLKTFEMAFPCVFWNTSMEVFYKTSAYLQSSSMNLFTGEGLLQSLDEFVTKNYFENSAKQINSVSQNFKQNKKKDQSREKKKQENMTVAVHLLILKTWWVQGINLRKIHSLLLLVICLLDWKEGPRPTQVFSIYLNVYIRLMRKSHNKEYLADIDDTIKSELTHLKLFVKNEEITPARYFN